MSTKAIIAKLKSTVRYSRPLLLAVAFMTSLAFSSVALAAPTPTTGDITGTVTDQNGVGLSGIKVDAYAPDGEVSSSNSVTWTASDGTYDLEGLPSGNYKVLFNNQPRSNEPGLYYATQWYNNQPDYGTPNLVSVSAGATTPDVNEVLAPAGVIAGKVVGGNGVSLSGIKVTVYAADSNMQQGASAWTEDDGMYYINRPGGNYTVLFNNMPTSESPGAYYTHEWYNNQPAGGEPTPDVVGVTNNVTTSHIDATLDPSGAVAGRVTDESGNGIPNVKITGYASLSDYNNPGSPVDAAFVFTDDSGSYFMGGLPASNGYIIDFNGPGESDPYRLEQFYNNQPSFDTANAVTVSNNVTTPDINATLQTLGAISGTVTDTTGAPAQARVSVYATTTDFYNSTPTASGQVGADGTYQLDHIPAGTYYLYFEPLPGYFYVPQFYNNQPTIGTASTITVVKGVTTPNFNARLSVLSPTTGTLEAHTNKLVPACMGPESDSLPGVCEALFAGESVAASANVNVHNNSRGPTGGVTFTFKTSTHSLRLVSKSISHFYIFGTNSSSAGVQGTATLTIDGVTTTNQFRVIATDGKLLGSKAQDRFGIYIWAPGVDQSTTTPLYFLNKALLNGNVMVRS